MTFLDPVGGPSTGSGTPENIISGIFDSLLGILLLLAGVLAVLAIIWIGIQYISSAGNTEKTKALQSSIGRVMLGVIIVISVYGIIKIAILVGNEIQNNIQQSSSSNSNNNPKDDSESDTTQNDTLENMSSVFQAFATTGESITSPIELKLDGFLKTSTPGSTITLTAVGPFEVQATPTGSQYQKCATTTTNTYSTTNTVLKVRFIATGKSSGQCFAAFEPPTIASVLKIQVAINDSSTRSALSGATFSIYDKSSSTYVKKEIPNVNLTLRGATPFKVERPGYRTCEESYDFQYSGPFTLNLTANSNPLPPNSEGGLNGNPRCHYTPYILHYDGIITEEEGQDGIVGSFSDDYDPELALSESFFYNYKLQELAKTVSPITERAFAADSRILNIPPYKQTNYRNVPYGCGSSVSTAGCGVVAVAMVLNFYQKKISVPSLATTALKTTNPVTGNKFRNVKDCGKLNGTDRAFINYITNKNGLGNRGANSWQEIVSLVRKGVPVIVSGSSESGQLPFTGDGHYVVLAGYDTRGTKGTNDDRLYVFDPVRQNKYYAVTRTFKGNLNWARAIYKKG